MYIPFNKPVYLQEYDKNIKKVLLKKNHFSSLGYFSKKSESLLNDLLNVNYSILTKSCTSALEMCALLLNIKQGDEIIMPSYTFVSTANAFVMRGGVPVFVDIKENDLNIDLNQIEKKITKRTKAIVVVHYAGISCNIEKLKKITKKYNLFLIEDAAQAFLSKYKNKYLGSYGDLSTFSFHETKNIHCGEGGALIINNKKFIKRAKILRDKGTNRDQFQKKFVKKYSWVDFGSSYALPEINAGFLYYQLLNSKKITRDRVNIWKKYFLLFSTLPKLKNLNYSNEIPKCKINGHIFYFLSKNKNQRDQIIDYFKRNNIQTTFHYIPLHESRMKNYCKFSGNFKITKKVSNTLIRLPLYSGLKDKELNKIFFYLKKMSNLFF